MSITRRCCLTVIIPVLSVFQIFVSYFLMMVLAMEIRVYRTVDYWNHKKTCFVSRVDCPDAFDYRAFVSVFNSIFGVNCVIEVIKL